MATTTLTERVGKFRWVICGLLFFATTINYVDRQVLGILAPDLQKEIGWSELDYGRIVIAFQASYAVMMLVWGKILDRIGTKVGLGIAVAWWSIAAMATGFARSAMTFGLFRFFLGVGEAANFPASIKTVAEWFPKSERALAVGIFNSGTNIGAVVAPLCVPLIAAIGKAADIARKVLSSYDAKVRPLRNMLEDGVLASIPNAELNGHKVRRLANTTSITFHGIELPNQPLKLPGSMGLRL